MKIVIIFTLFINTTYLETQEKNYFYQIKEFEENYSQNAILSRFLHSVGFRYFWATEGLNDRDLKYKPSDSGINSRETLEHIYGLSIMINNGLSNKPIVRSKSYPDLSFDNLRKNTLDNLKNSIDLVENFSKSDFEDNKIIFGDLKFDLFNLFHGPISDSLYHIGQIVVFRRASGNPIPRGVNHFMGIKMQ